MRSDTIRNAFLSCVELRIYNRYGIKTDKNNYHNQYLDKQVHRFQHDVFFSFHLNSSLRVAFFASVMRDRERNRFADE